MTHDRRVDRHDQTTVYNGFFKIEKISISYQGFDGQMIGPSDWEVFERGDSVAVLLFNRDISKVILVEQFRAPVYEKSKNNGWIIELIAGMTQNSEGIEHTAIRETLEETGYRIEPKNLERIDTFFSSPGGTSERIYLYYADVQNAGYVEQSGGNRLEYEDVRLVELGLQEFFRRLDDHEFEDPKLIIAGHWLRKKFEWEKARGNDGLATETIEFRGETHDGRGGKAFIIGYKTGDLSGINDVDIWVNSESTDMEMDKFTGLSVSSIVRSLGAKKNKDGCIIEDLIGRDLEKRKAPRKSFAPATVIETKPGKLTQNRNVKRLLHVASFPGNVEFSFKRDVKMVADCTRNVLAKANEYMGLLGRGRSCQSILIPIFGTGQGGHTPEEVIPLIIKSTVEFMDSNPTSGIRRIYLSAYSARHRAICERTLIDDYGNRLEKVVTNDLKNVASERGPQAKPHDGDGAVDLKN